MFRNIAFSRSRQANRGFRLPRLSPGTKILVLAMFSICAFFAVRSAVSSAQSVPAQEPAITVHAAGRGKGLLNPRDGKALRAEFTGASAQSEALRTGAARPLSLATADFDLDGAPDLITGYDYAGGGLVTLQRGNIEAFVPTDRTAFDRAAKGEVAPSFLPETQTVELPERADFILADDLNQDSHADLLVAARGGGIYVVMNDGHGALSLTERIELPGTVTALTEGAFTHASGYRAVIAGIVGPDGPALAVIDQNNDGLSSTPVLVPLPAPAVNLVLGIFDADPYNDLAVAAGNEIIIVHGQKPSTPGNRKAVDLKQRMETIDAGFPVASIAAGTFVPEMIRRMDLAALSTDGTVHIFQRQIDAATTSEIEARSATLSAIESLSEYRRQRSELIKASALVPMWEPAEKSDWAEVTQLETRISAVTTDGPPLLIGSSKVSFRRTDDLLLLDSANREVHVLINDNAAPKSDSAVSVASRSERVPVSLGVEGAPLSVLPMRQKISGELDLMILNAGSTTAARVPLQPSGVTLTVNTITDLDRSPGTPNTQCNGAGGDCSLREAVLKANVNSGPNTINVPGNIGTYNLSINNPNSIALTGTVATPDLMIGSATNLNTTVTGTSGVPHIVQTIANNDVVTTGLTTLPFPANAADVTLVLQSLEISGGTFTGVFTGADDNAGHHTDTTLTSCNVHNNSNPANPNGQGGGHFNQCGNLTVNTTTYASNQATNSADGQGGAIFYDIVNASGSCSVGTLTVTNSTFTSNVATVGATFGGGGAIFADVIGTGSATSITNTVFTSNQAAGGSDGGALALAGTRTYNVKTNTFVTNSTTNASGRGGAVDGIGSPLNLNFNRFVGNTTVTTQNGQAVFNNAATFNANNNWWTTNAGPDTSCGASNPCDVAGSPTLTDWLILRDPPSGANVHNGNQIAPSSSCTVQADILGLHLGGSTAPSNLTGLDTFPASPATVYDNPVLGTTTPSSPVSSQFVNGVATAIIFNSNGTKGTGGVRATADSQQVTDPIVIGFDPEYVNTAGAGDVTNAFLSAGCGAGNTPCFSSIGLALTNVAISGTIHIQASTYNENALFDSPLCQTCVGTIDGSVQLNGTLTIGTATIQGSSNTLSLTGDFTKTGGTFTPGTGTVNFNGSTNQTITNNAASLTFNNLTVTKGGGALATGANPTTIVTNDLTMTSGNFTAPASLDINGNTLLSAGTLTAGTNITAAGNWTNNGGTFTPGSGTVTFDGAGAQAINGSAASQTFNNFVVNKSNTLSTGGSTTSITTNNLTMTLGSFTAPATLDINGNTLLTAGTLTAGTNIMSGGNWTNNGGTFTPGSGTVTFDSTSATQTINGSAASQTFNNVVVDKTAQILNTGGSTTTVHTTDLTMTNGTFTAPATLDINGNFTLNGGTLTAGTNITAAGNWTNNNTDPSFAPGSNTVTFDGAGAQAINGTVLTQTFHHVTVNKGGNTLSIGGSTNEFHVVDFNLSGGTFAQSASAFFVGGNLTASLGTTFTKASGGQALTFNNSSSQSWTDNTVSGQDFGNVVIGGTTNTVTLQTNIKMTNLTVNSGDVFVLNTHNFTFSAAAVATNNGTIRLAGNETLTNVTNFDTAEGLVEYVGRNIAETLTIKDFGATDYFNLSINDTHANKATFSLGSTLTVAGNLTLASGTLSAVPNAIINIAGNWTNNGGTFTPGAGTVTFNSTAGTQSINGSAATQTFNHITVDKSGQTLSVGGSTTTLTLNGTLTLQAGTFDAGTATAINVAGNWTNNSGTSAFTAGSSTVTFNGSASGQNIGGSAATTFKDLASNNSSTGVTIGVDGLTVTGQFTVQGGTFTAVGTFNTNNDQINNTATLTMNAGATINITGNWINSGTFNPASNALVSFNGLSSENIGGSASTPFARLTINNSAGVTLGVDTTVNNTLTLTLGDLNTGSFTLTMPSTAGSSGTTDVVGNVKRTGFSTSGANTLSFGNPLNTIQINSDSVGGDTIAITVNLVKSAPSGPGSGFPGAVARTYTITPTGITGTISSTLQLRYLVSDLGTNTEATLRFWKFIGTGWQQQDMAGTNTTVDLTNHDLKLTGVTSFSPWTMADVSPTAANGNVSGRIVDANGNPVEGTAVRISGTENRLTVTDAQGNYHFDNVETNGFYTVTPSRANFTFSPVQRSFSQLGLHTDAAFAAAATSTTLNPLDTTEYFVRQQYVDFLNREPDEAGLNFWFNNIESCGADQNCRAAKRTDTSAAFFLSIEFQQTGYLVERVYKASYGDMPNAPVPIALNEFKPDTQEIGNGVVVNQAGWQQQLENNKQAYLTDFVQRTRFVSAYPTTLTPAEFVDKLFLNAGVTDSASDRNAAINEFGSATTTRDTTARARALRQVAENAALAQKEFDSAFVLMQYFGYLRRDPNTGPDTNFDGYNFWLTKLDTFNGNFRQAEMVKAFLIASEYRQRFPR